MKASELTDNELGALLDEYRNEYLRRMDLVKVQEQMPEMAEALQITMGREPGTPWVQPLGEFDAYLIDWEVTHNGKEWVSLVNFNVWEPGVSLWREKTLDGGVPEWVQPTGAHDAYAMGDQVTFDGVVWVSTAENNTWKPGEYGWDQVNAD